MAVNIDLGGDPSFDLVPQGKYNLHGRVEWKPATNEYRVVKADGTKVSISGTQTRPKNRSMSNVGLDDPGSESYGQQQCLWDNAAFEPAIDRVAPPSFTGNAVASWRLFDDSDRCWWIVVEAVSDQLVVWLHRPATIFLQQMQPLPENCRELHRFSIPQHLVGEPVTVTFSPRGNKAVLQVITDKSEIPMDAPANISVSGGGSVDLPAAPERYTVPWAQFVRVVELSGVGSWPEVADTGSWGDGIVAAVSGYSSPWSSGSFELDVGYSMKEPVWIATSIGSGLCEGPFGDEPHQYMRCELSAVYSPFLLDHWDYPSSISDNAIYGAERIAGSRYFYSYAYGNRVERLDVPILVFFDGDQICEFSALVDISDVSDLSIGGTLVKGGYGSFEDGIWHGDYGEIDSDSRFVNFSRSADWSVSIKKNGAEFFSLLFSDSVIGDNRNVSCIVNGNSAAVPGIDSNPFYVDHRYGRKHLRPFFFITADKETLSIAASLGHLLPEGGYGFGEGNGYYREHRWAFVGSDSVSVGDLPSLTLYSALDQLGRRYTVIPDDWRPSDVQNNREPYMNLDLNLILHSLNGGGFNYFQFGVLDQWKDYNAWMVLGYC